MEVDADLQPSHEMTNRSRLNILLIEGGVEALTDILVEQLLRSALELKKDHLKSKIGSTLYQQQFDVLYPKRGRLPRFEDMDNVILGDIILKEVLVIPFTGLTNTDEENINIIVQHIKGKLLTEHLVDKKSFLLSSHKPLGREHWDLLYPTTTVVNINEFDISLLTFILSNTFDLVPTSGNWKEEPSDGHTSVADDIVRLCRHRNSLCHNSSYGISDTEFNSQWADITSILMRLLGSSYREKIDKLKAETLDPVRDRKCQKMLNEWHNHDIEVKDLMETLVDTVQTDINEVSKRVEVLEMNEHRRKRPTDSMIVHVKYWEEKEDVVFCKTRASEAVEYALRTQNIVTITGAPGSGKSLIAKHIALQYQREGYDIYPLLKLEQFDEFYCIDKKQLFFFDDPVGDLQLKHDLISKLRYWSEKLRSVIKRQNVKLLITMKSNLMKDIAVLEINSVLTDNEINITIDELKLDEKEKVNIFTSHSQCKNESPLKAATLCPFDCFPLLCHVYSTSEKKGDIFVDPFSVLKNQFIGLYQNNKMQFVALLLCSVMEECYEELFDGFQNNERLTSDRNVMNSILTSLGISSPRHTYSEIKDQLNAMCGVFLHKVEDTYAAYTFISDVFREIVIYCMGQISTGFIFKHFTGEMICERVRIGKMFSSDDKDLVILLPDKEMYWNMMRDRVITDFMNNDFSNVFMNPYVTSSYIEEPLCSTITSGDFQNNGLDGFSRSALHWAVSMGNENITKCLLETKVNIDQQDENGASALVVASCNGNTREVGLLLDKKADCNLHDSYGNNALSYAVSNDKEEMLKLLLDHGADANIYSSPHFAPLLLSLQYNKTEMVRLLLQHNTKTDISLSLMQRPLFLAAFNNNTEVAKLLIAENANIKDEEEGATALIFAAEHGNRDMASLLLSAGANINAKSKGKDTAIVASVRGNNTKMISFLIDHGANVNSRGILSKPFLFKETAGDIFKKIFETLDFLLVNKKWDVSVFTGIKNSIKHPCEVANRLLDSISDLDGRAINEFKSNISILTEVSIDFNNINNIKRLQNLDAENFIELVTGAVGYFIKIFREIGIPIDASYEQSSTLRDIQLLFRNVFQPSINSRNAQVFTALTVAVCYENIDAVKLLLDRGACVKLPDIGHTCLKIAICKENIELVTLLLNNNVDVNLRDNDGNAALHVAVNIQNEEIVKLLLDSNADVNITENIKGMTPLLCTICTENEQILKLLLNKKADVNLSSNDGHAALHYATKIQNVEIMKLLLNSGLDVNLRDNNGWTALHSAVDKKNEEIVNLLLSSYANVNLSENNGFTALHFAVIITHVEIVKLLLNSKADVNSINKFGETALHHAVSRDNEEVVELLLKNNAVVNLSNNAGLTPLILSVGQNSAEYAKLLLNNHADVDLCDKTRSTALHWAIVLENVKIVEVLLNNKADVNLINDNSLTPMHIAASMENVKFLTLMLKHNADVNLLVNGNAALHLAVHNQKVDSVKKLLNNKADVNLANADGNTALHLATKALLVCQGDTVLNDSRAAKMNNIEITKLLLNSKADVNLSNNIGLTALLLAAKVNNVEIAKLLLTTCTNVHVDMSDNDGCTALHWAIGKNNIEMVQLLLNNHADVNFSSSDGQTTLHYAAKVGNVEIMKLLLKSKADVNLPDKDGDTALLCATVKSNVEMVKLLINNHANVNLFDNAGRTALQFSAKLENVEMTQLLLNSDGDVDLRDNDGYTALHWAVVQNNVEIVKLLLNRNADINVPDNNGRTARTWALVKNNVELLTLFLNSRSGVDENKKNSEIAHILVTLKNNADFWKILKNNAYTSSCDTDGDETHISTAERSNTKATRSHVDGEVEPEIIYSRVSSFREKST